MSNKNLSPDDTLTQLKAGASARKQKSLDLLHVICGEQYAAGSKDFSVRTIGRISAARGGPSEQPIRNKPGEEYRALLSVWAAWAGTSARKPAAPKDPTLASSLLEMIDDPAVRVLTGSILAENRKLRNENALLKKQTEVIIDRRPQSHPAQSKAPVVEVLPTLNLTSMEVEALKEVLDKAFLARMGWSIDEETGRVRKGGHPVFRPGFATAIRKILEKSN